MLPKGLLKEYARPLSFLLRGADVVAVLAAGYTAFYAKFGHMSVSLHYSFAMALGALVTLVVFPFFNVYQSVRATGFWLSLRNLIQAMVVVVVLLAGLAFFAKVGESYSRIWFTLWTAISIVLLVVFRSTLWMVLRIMRSRGWNERRVVIIGTSELSAKLIAGVHQAVWTGFKVVAAFDDEKGETPKQLSAYLAEASESIDEIWLALPLQAEARVKEILHELRHDTVTTRFVLDIFGLDLLNHSVSNLVGFPALNIRSTPMIGMNRVYKAIEDRLLAFIILVLISPLLLVIALAVKLTSKGPVFYRQKRVSWNGKEFDMLKFRSMPVNIEANTGPVWAQAGENRATKVGSFLRKTSLDELPQFINVLRGDMSIVGPRPERLVFVDQFKHEIPQYMQKHLVKAGITGWAQVNGWRGNTDLQKRIEYDLYYIENWSVLFDLKIIFLTIFHGFTHKNAY